MLLSRRRRERKGAHRLVDASLIGSWRVLGESLALRCGEGYTLAMQITIDEGGHISPPNSATFITMKPVAETLVEGQDMSDSGIGIYQCNACGETFEAPRGQVTTHECDSPEE